MSRINRVYRSIEFIEANLKEPISIRDVAEAAGYSLYHFSRVFNQTTRHSPYDYIVRRRLSEAVKDLIETEKRVTDIAFDYWFNSVESFSRAFKKMFNALPSSIRGGVDSNVLMLKLPITYDFIMHINRCNFFTPRLVELETKYIIGTIFHSFSDNLLKDARGGLQKDPRLIEDGAISEDPFFVSFYPMNWRLQSFSRMMCIEVGSLDKIPMTCVGKILPGSKYAMFTHRGPSTDLGMTFDYIYQTWLHKSGCILGAPFSLEYCSFGGADNEHADLEITVFVPIRVSNQILF